MAEKTWRKYIFRPSRAVYSIVIGGIRTKFKLILAFMHVLVTYKNEEDQIKNEGARVQQSFSHCMLIIPDMQGQLFAQSQVRAGQN